MQNVIIILFSLLISTNVLAKNKTQIILERAKIVKAITKAAKQVGAPQDLVLAVCYAESSFRNDHPEKPDGKGGRISYGVCQVQLQTALFMDKYWKLKIKATPERLRIPFINAFYAAKYLQYQLEEYDNNWKMAVDAYNKGTFNGKKLETEYVMRVIVASQKHGLILPGEIQ